MKAFLVGVWAKRREDGFIIRRCTCGVKTPRFEGVCGNCLKKEVELAQEQLESADRVQGVFE